MNEHAKAKTIDCLNHQYIFSFQDFLIFFTKLIYVYKDL